MNRIEVDYVEDCSELDPQAPGVWAQGSIDLEHDSTAPQRPAVVEIHPRQQRRPHRLQRFRRVLQSWSRRARRVRQPADNLS